MHCAPNKNKSRYHSFTYLRYLGHKFIAEGRLQRQALSVGLPSIEPLRYYSPLENPLSSTSHIVLPPDQHTYWPTSLTKRPDILDYFIASSSFNHINSNISNLCDPSDHSPILLILDTHPFPVTPKPPLINGPFHCESFQTYLHNKITVYLHNKITVKISINTNGKWRCRGEIQPLLTAGNMALHWSWICQNHKTDHVTNRNKWQRTQYPSDKAISH